MNGINPDRSGIFLDVLENIINDLNGNAELQGIFGIPVSRALIIVADQNDLRIEEGGRVELSTQQQKVFLRVLDEIILANRI